MSHFLYLTPQILLPFSPLTSQEFEEIRCKVGASWQNETRWSNSCMTTYEGSYRKKQLDEFPVSRQHEPQRPQMVMLKDTAYDLPPCQAGPQETADVIGLFPNITGPLKNSLNIKHRVAHQVWGFGGDLSRAPPNSRNICKSHCVKPKKVYFDILEHCNRGRKNFPKTLYKQCESESKIFGSSEDSEGGQHSGYGRGRLLSLFD
uniref:Chromosome 4 open reading frame 51 n=1 Tax=Spermophilus dauricus TaxID=99837 RepID=A0A8C9PKG0_SPEDA